MRTIIALLGIGATAMVINGCDGYYGCSDIEEEDSEMISIDIETYYPDATEICIYETDDECVDDWELRDATEVVLRAGTIHDIECESGTDTASTDDTGTSGGDTGDTADTADTADSGVDTGISDTGVEDADGDGWDSDVDCDDNDTDFNLDDADGDGVTTCDLDCDDDDAEVGAAANYWVDDDDDGYGTGAAAYVGCSEVSGYADNDDDCNDEDADVNPDAEEVCGDEIDNDCDGDVDEDCETCADDLGEGVSWLCVDGGTISMAYDELTWDQADDYVGTWSDPDMSEIAISGIGIGDQDWSYDADYLVDYDSSTNWFSYDHDTIGWYRTNFRSEAAWAYFEDMCESSTETSVLCYEDTSGRYSLMYYFDGAGITY